MKFLNRLIVATITGFAALTVQAQTNFSTYFATNGTTSPFFSITNVAQINSGIFPTPTNYFIGASTNYYYTNSLANQIVVGVNKSRYVTFSFTATGTNATGSAVVLIDAGNGYNDWVALTAIPLTLSAGTATAGTNVDTGGWDTFRINSILTTNVAQTLTNAYVAFGCKPGI